MVSIGAVAVTKGMRVPLIVREASRAHHVLRRAMHAGADWHRGHARVWLTMEVSWHHVTMGMARVPTVSIHLMLAVCAEIVLARVAS